MVCWVNVQNQSIHSPIDGYLDFFPAFSSLNSAATHFCVCLLMPQCGNFSMTFPGVELPGQCSTSHDNNANLFSKGVAPVDIPTQKWLRVPVDPLGIMRHLNFCQPSGRKIIFHPGLPWRFSNNQWDWASEEVVFEPEPERSEGASHAKLWLYGAVSEAEAVLWCPSSADDREVRQGSWGREGRRAVPWGLGAHGTHCTVDWSLRVMERCVCVGGSSKGSNMISLILKRKRNPSGFYTKRI